MKKNAQLLTAVVLTVVGACVGLVVFARRSEQRESAALVDPQHVERERPTEDSTSQRAERLFARWEAEYAEQNLYTKTRIPMDFSRAFSARFSKARGQAEINFQSGEINVSVANLDPLPEGARYECWLVDQVAGPQNSAALDLGEDGDRILNLGVLPTAGSLKASVETAKLAELDVDMAVVVQVAADQPPEYVIGGMQSIRFQIGRRAFDASLAAASTGRTPLRNLTLVARPVIDLVAQGRDLFINGTFGGNGRTCATCHPLDNEFTIDPVFIATLPATDPLFIAELDPNLPPFDPQDPNKPAMEFPALMDTRGLILENIDGFALDASGKLVRPPVFRAVPSLFNLEFTAPYGDSACCSNLQNFSAGAVVQHFTKDLRRRSKGKTKDFVLPTATELKALEAFMLSNTSPADRNFSVSGAGSLLSTVDDPTASATSRAEVRGRIAFESVGCTLCHSNTVFAANLNLTTGVEVEEHTLALQTPTLDDGVGVRNFQVPQLFGLRKQHFFHTGLRGNAGVALPGESLRFTNLRDAVSFYASDAFKNSPTAADVPSLTNAQIDDIAAFLEAISNP